MYWHLPALASIHSIANALVDNLVDGVAPPDMSALLPVLSIDPVLGF